MSETTPTWRQQPSPEHSVRFQASYRRRRRLLFGGIGLLFALWIVVIVAHPTESAIIAIWAAYGVYGVIGSFVLWRCPRCGIQFGRRWRVERCPHCWLELEPKQGSRPAD